MAANVFLKRLNSEELENFQSDPLDVMAVPAVGKDGAKKVVPALSVGFMEPRHYVMYKPLPYLFLPSFKKVNSARIEEWLERTAYLEEDLSWLLRLPHHRFWSQVVYDEDLHLCLQSYLSNAPRDYDFNPNASKDVVSRERTLHKLVFLILLRMSTYKESKLHHITPKIFGEIIYDNFVFDVPRMMDICVMYWFRNQAIINRMMVNLFSQQPSYYSDLEETVPCVLMAFDSLEERLGLREGKTLRKIEDSDSGVLSHLYITEIQDIINFIADVSATLFTFTESYNGSCLLFFKSQGNLRIPSFYDLVFPLLEIELKNRTNVPEYESFHDVVRNKISLSKSFLIRFFRNVIATSCIQPLLESKCSEASSEDNAGAFHLNDYLETFMEICTEKYFLCHYNLVFPIQDDLDTFSDSGIPLDPASVKYVLSCVEPSNPQKTEVHYNGVATIQVKEKQSRISNVQPEIKDSSNPSEQPSTSRSFPEGAAASAKPDEAELQSLIQLVSDIIPEAGDGFIEMCLEYYNYSSEKVIDALLCNSLPPHLDGMDRSLKRQKPAEEKKSLPSILSERRSIFDYDEFDVFNREDIPMDRIHKGKSNKTPTAYDILVGEGTSQTLKDLILEYERKQEEEEEQQLLHSSMYEDEYDDTYDSHGINIMEPQPENELNRPFTVPVALRSMKKGAQSKAQNEESEEEDGDDNGNNNEEQEEKKPEPPRDSFCENPELIRQRAEQRRETKLRNKGIDPEKPKTFQNKERHKGQTANHNRRKQADFKRSRGMGGLPSR